MLLVDDEEILRAMAGRALRQLGYDVLEARYGTEALELWRQHRDDIHVLVTDIVMPGLSGVEVAQQIAAERPDAAIVLMSGYADACSSQQLPVRSQAVFLEKPFTPSVLVDAVRDAIRRWSQAVPTA